MKYSEHPPTPKKGIQVIQSSQTSHKQSRKVSEKDGSQLRSIRSTSRSRGISMSRQTGINLDRIYDHKHFMPVSGQNKAKQNNLEQPRTLISYKSLKFINLCEGSQHESNNKQENVEEFKIKNNAQQKGSVVKNTPSIRNLLDSKSSENSFLKQQSKELYHPKLISF